MRVLGFGLQSFRGAAFRFYLVVFTDGTFDVALWEGHSRDVIERGVVACYHINGSANHPPFISKAEAVLLRVSGRWDLPVIPTGLQSFSGFATLLTLFFLLAQFGFSFREYGKRGSAKCSLCCRNRQRAAEDKLLGYNSGIPKPPVIFFISDWASALPCSIACCTPLKTASSKNSTSFGSTIA